MDIIAALFHQAALVMVLIRLATLFIQRDQKTGRKITHTVGFRLATEYSYYRNQYYLSMIEKAGSYF